MCWYNRVSIGHLRVPRLTGSTTNSAREITSVAPTITFDTLHLLEHLRLVYRQWAHSIYHPHRVRESIITLHIFEKEGSTGKHSSFIASLDYSEVRREGGVLASGVRSYATV